jgi:serine/threonine protein kinase
MSTFTPAIRDFLSAPEATRRLGPYRCKDLLDKAGTAPVFKAIEEHAGLSLREVAIKVFDIGKADGWQARVVDEARSLCKVQHPNVIRFHTLSTDPKRGLMGIVMEFAEGVSVEKQLADVPKGDASRVALAVEIGIAIAAALEAAHDAGIVHCNVKPSNIMFTDGTHKLINFGIAASLRSDDKKKDEDRDLPDDLAPDSIGRKASTLAKDGAPITGTIGYVDPVCVRTTAPPTASSDLYSLGATLYQCIAGRVPAATDKGVDRKVVVGDASPTPLAEAAPGTPPELAKLIDTLVSPTREARPRSADAVLRSLERIRSALAGHDRALPGEERGPFTGLALYEAADRDVFFGRSAEIAGVIELLRTRGLVGIVGLSGTGKSSLARAGVVPAVEEGAVGGWPSKYRSVVVTPGTDLMKALRTALEKLVDASLPEHPEAIAQELAANVDATGQGIVILVDQLEEVVTLHEKKRDESRLAALDLLSRLAEAPAGLRVVVTARRDLLDGILEIDPAFSRALSRGIQHLRALTGSAWEEVVDQSLEAYGYSFESDDLRKDVLSDLRARESAMPLAQFGLSRLWAARDAKKKKIPRAAFSDKGGMHGALEHHADATIAEAKIPKDTLRDMFLAMTTPEGTRAHASRESLVSRFGAPAKDAITVLVKARLLVEDAAGVTFVHDSVLREWRLVRGWLDEARDDRMLTSHLERDAMRWSEAHDATMLWRKARLAEALDLQKRGSVSLSETASSFLAHSANEERKGLIIRWSIGVVVVAIIVGGALVYAKDSKEAADRARRDADALAAALAEVRQLKRQTEENALEAAASAQLLQNLQRKQAEDHASTLKKVASATSLEGAVKAAEDIKHSSAVVPLGDLTGLSGSGPKLDTSGPSPSVGGGGFDQAAIERVVNSRKAGVKRTCLDKASSNASTTKVTASITIAPNGQVQSVSSSGDDPVVAKCIENQLRSWTFPAPGETKTVQIPFVFVRQ